ncbi:MAG: hypothetical protein EAX96_04980 [Candidatus Lokiarchaeota archaeon]|nr:hypothetical protein [Candidatus Lokiarchaeota archaeon]
MLLISYNRIRKALFKRNLLNNEWRKKWREERNREDKSNPENELYLKQIIDVFRKKISNEITLKISLRIINIKNIHSP